MIQFHSIVRGEMKSRVYDVWGSGQFGASRKGRMHKGIDVVAKKDEDILSPIDGNVIREAFPYPDDKRYRGILIRGERSFSGYEVKLFYVNGFFSGAVDGGKLVGRALDLTERYNNITNHVHMEVYRAGTCIDPREVYLMCF